MDFEKKMRCIPTNQAVFRSSKRVETFKAVDCITILSKEGWTADEIKKGIQKLLHEYKILKVVCEDEVVDIIPGQTMSISDCYMWAEEQISYMNLVYGVLIILLLLCLIMFQMWPLWMRRTVGYVRYPLYGFLVFMLVMGVVRLVVYGITVLLMPNGLWILPNLFAECGFFESFVPLYVWADDRDNSSQERSSNKSDSNKNDSEKSSSNKSDSINNKKEL